MRLRRCAFAALGVALAAGGCTVGEAPPGPDGSPTGPPAISDRQPWLVELSEFTVTYRLDAVVAASDGVDLEVPTGMSFRPAPGADGEVAGGQTLGELRVDPANEAQLGGAEGTVAASRLGVLRGRTGEVVAPVAGVAEIDEDGRRIARTGLDVVADLSPLQTLRYEGMAFAGAADVETVVGQRKVECQAVWLSAKDDGEDAGAGSRVHCRLPDNAETVAGIPAVMTLASPKLTDVIAVPYLFVGLDAAGEDYVVNVFEGDSTVERPVVVGVTDGVRRVIHSGINPGDELVAIPQ